MKFTRRRMLDSFEQLEIELESSLGNMEIYHNMSDKELARVHRETFGAMYEGGYNYGYDYDSQGNKIYLKYIYKKNNNYNPLKYFILR